MSIKRPFVVGVERARGSTAFEDLQRGVHFADEELLLVPDEMPTGGVGEFVEDDMVRDAFELEDE